MMAAVAGESFKDGYNAHVSMLPFSLVFTVFKDLQR